MRFDLARIEEGIRARDIAAPHSPVDSGEIRYAAVAVILREPSLLGANAARGSDAELLVIRRAERTGDPWSGHMALPGGRFDPEDRTLERTAVRETREEVGLDLDRRARGLGALPPVAPRSAKNPLPLLVQPFLYVLEHDDEFVLNEEVAEAMWLSLGPLARGELSSTFDYEYGGVLYTLPSFDVEGRVIWGMTHRMLESLFELVRDSSASK